MTDFDEYIRQGDPDRRSKGEAWQTAIGLQAVDGLKPSAYLLETARKDIEGEITIDEADELIKSYYRSKALRTPEDEQAQEADKASLNIRRILSENTFAFTFVGLVSVHRRIFDGVYRFAGKIRDYNITKKEWVLRGDTVLYVSASDIISAVEYDLEQERRFDYSKVDRDGLVKHISRFVADLWQIHPFGEGNTRTTAVFAIQYLRSMGFNIDNTPFSDNSWYFRNALVRANYQNVQKGIMRNPQFLELFFRNLLLGESNELKNRYMLVSPPEDFKERISTPTSTPTSAPTSIAPDRKDQLMADNDNIVRLVLTIGDKRLSVREILLSIGLKDRENLIEYSLNPAIKDGFVTMLYPDKPRHPRQKYILTPKGYALLNEMRKGS